MCLFLETAFKDMIVLKCDQQDWPGVLIKRGNLYTKTDTRDVCTQRKDHVRTQWKDGHLQAKPSDTLILKFKYPEL